MKIKKIICVILSLTLMPLWLMGCDGGDSGGGEIVDPKTQAKSYYDLFDTVSVIISYKGDSADDFARNCETVRSVLGDYHRLFDIYFEYSGINNLKTVNKNAGIAPVKVDDRLIDFLIYTKEIYSLTGGETNVAMGAVLKLWHDEREAGSDNPDEARIPSESELEAAALHTNIDDLIIDEEAGTVYLADPLMSLDVGAVGKGYATERAAEALIDMGVSSYVLNVGGNLRTIGEKPSGNGWTTGITNPDKSSPENFACRVIIKNESLVTSGDYERYYYADGVKYHHIIDPDTNMPARYFSSVSIFTEDGGLADSLSTALFCMSYEDGLKLLSSLEGVKVLWILPDGTLLHYGEIQFING